MIYKAGELDAMRDFEDVCDRILYFCADMREKYKRAAHESWMKYATEEERAKYKLMQADRVIAEKAIDRYRPVNRPGCPRTKVRRHA